VGGKCGELTRSMQVNDYTRGVLTNSRWRTNLTSYFTANEDEDIDDDIVNNITLEKRWLKI
jgi:hypothetical protein